MRNFEVLYNLMQCTGIAPIRIVVDGKTYEIQKIDNSSNNVAYIIAGEQNEID